MIKSKKQLRLFISTTILLSIIGSIAVPVLAQNNKIRNALISNQHIVEEKRRDEKPQVLTQNITTPPKTNNPIEAIQAKAEENRKHRLHKQDEYNYSKKDVEELLLGGASLEDIYRSDEIGNQWFMDPKALIKTKRQEKQSWDEIETTLSSRTSNSKRL